MPTFVTRTVGDVVAEVVMSRANFTGSFLVLEGDHDSRFWSQRISKTDCQIIIAGSKPTVIDSVIRANGIRIGGILGIVDDDYDSVCGIRLASSNTIRTDCRDLETMLVKSGALEKVIHELGDPIKIAAFETATGKAVRDAVVERSLLFGKLRWLDKQKKWRFDFDQLSPYRFGNIPNWSIDEPGVVGVVAPAVGISTIQLRDELAVLAVPDPYLVLHGKDTAAVLAMGLRGKLGNYQHSVERVCQMLRLGFDDTMAKGTNLFKGVARWEILNAPFRVLS